MINLKPRLYKAAIKVAYSALGLPVFEHYRWLTSSQNWSREQRETWKLKQLNEILDFAWKNVPFYRSYWGDHHTKRAPLSSLDELQRYPILTKNVFRSHSQDIRPSNLNTIPHLKKFTGGTTGNPIHHLQDKKQWALMQAFHFWGWEQAGWKFGDPVGVIAGGSLVPERVTIRDRLRSAVENRMFLFGVQMDRVLAREYWKRLDSFQVRFLYGYPSILYLFGKYLHEEKLRLSNLRAVITTGETLHKQYRDSIQATLDCAVFNDLGCNDGGYEAYECQFHNGLHYNDLQSILETSTSGHPEGHLIITNLWNRSTPFVRYENGDIVSLTNDHCPCGSSFPQIASISGRTCDILTFANGKSLSGPALTLIFRAMEIDSWQVVQTTMTNLEVRLSGVLNKNQYKYESYIREVLEEHLGDGVVLTIKYVTDQLVTKSGKLKPVWSEVSSHHLPASYTSHSS